MVCWSGSALAQARPARAPATPGLYGVDLGVAGAGQFTTSITNQPYATNGALLPSQGTTLSAGALATLRDHPLRFVTLEANYQFTHFSEKFSNVQGSPPINGNVTVPTSMHEFTGAYVIQHSGRNVTPYVGLGGGYLFFQPPSTLPLNFHHQVRGAALVDMGFDFRTNTRIGIRIGGHALAYRAPEFTVGQLSSSRWVTTTEPYIGAHYTF